MKRNNKAYLFCLKKHLFYRIVLVWMVKEILS